MARMRRALRLRPVNTVKNIIDNTSLGIAAATNTTVNLVTCVNAYAGGAGQVPIGAKVRSIYLFVQGQCDAANGNIDWYISKNPANQMTKPTPGATTGHPFRRFIFHEEKGLPGDYSTGAGPLTFKGVIRIPPRFCRMGEDDRIDVVFRGLNQYSFCLKAIYKFAQ